MTFQNRTASARAARFLGGFPNFYSEQRDVTFVSGSIFVTAAAAEAQDIPLAALRGITLDDFEGRMGAVNMYAVEHGFVGGFPTYNNEDYGSGMVCGAILLRAEAAEYREVPLAALGNPALGDFEQRFRATQDYASANGFVGGFPNLLQSEKRIDFETGQRFTVCGTILLRSDSWDMTTGRRLHIAEWRNV